MFAFFGPQLVNSSAGERCLVFIEVREESEQFHTLKGRDSGRESNTLPYLSWSCILRHVWVPLAAK